MSRRGYLLVGKILNPVFIVGLKAVTKLTGIPRVRVIVTNEKHQILLMQGVVSNRRWTLPGGGVKRGETALAAARRELLEEAGIDVKETALTYLTTLAQPRVDISFVAPIFHVRVRQSDLPKKPINRWEVADIGWFDKKALPEPLSVIVRESLKELRNRLQ